MRHQIDRYVGTTRVRISTGAKTPAERRAALALFDKLERQASFLAIVEALEERRIKWEAVRRADEEGRLASLLSELLLEEPLWTTVERLFGGRGPTERRYRTSFWQLRESGVLHERLARVRDLKRLDWRQLERTWGRSPADWNHLRRALSRFLSLLFRSKRHTWRDELLFAFPTRREVPRRPRGTIAEFVELVESLSEPVALRVFLVLATGMRKSEAERTLPEHLEPGVINVPGTKTEKSRRRVPVDPRLWPLVVAAVATRPSAECFRREWRAAREKVHRPDLRLHDLRRIVAQLLHGLGRPLTSIQELLGHASLAMTADYATAPAGQADAAALASVLAPVAKVLPMRRAK